jgi:radical SAM superfamily enzyme YgiQ (UPF0313 family)
MPLPINMKESTVKDRQKKILLIHPPFYRLFADSFSYNKYPPSLGYLACTIKKQTVWDVLVYNADFNSKNLAGSSDITFSFRSGLGYSNYMNCIKNPEDPIWSEVKSVIEDYAPDVVGISTMTPNFTSACMVSRFVKRFNQNVPVIVGGPHPSIVGRSALDSQYIDIGVRGEGERTIVEILNSLENGQQLDQIRGIIYKLDGEVVETEPREYIGDLATLCFPHESAPEALKDFDHYPLTAFGNVFANRGCPFSCAFCASRGIWGRHVRFRPVEHVIREIAGLQQKGLTSIYFCDDTFGLNKRWLSDLCHGLIRQCPGLKWSCETHAQVVNDETLSLMRKAGCYKIELGIESGDNEVLRKMRKQTTIEEALAAAAKIKKHGIELHTYFLVGLPFETEESLAATFKAIKKLKNRSHIFLSIYCPYPNTELYHYCVEQGIIEESTYDVSLYNQWSLDHFCPNIAPDLFEKTVHEMQEFVDRSNQMYRLKRMISLSTFWRLKELGVKESLVKAKKILFPRR